MTELLSEGLAFHHIGVACRDLDADEEVFKLMGYQREGDDFFDPIQGVHGRFLVGGGPRLELLRDHDDRGVLAPWLKNRTKFYHLAYQTDSLLDSTAQLMRQGAKQVVAPVPAVAFENRKIAFFMLRNLALIELISRAFD